MEKNKIISDWLDQYGNPEIDKFVETQLNQNNMTAVEWLLNELSIAGYFPYGIPPKIEEQAKAMEKEQIKNERVEAYNNGYANGQKDAYTE